MGYHATQLSNVFYNLNPKVNSRQGFQIPLLTGSGRMAKGEVVKNGNTSMIFVGMIFVLRSSPFSYLRTVHKFKNWLSGKIIAFFTFVQ